MKLLSRIKNKLAMWAMKDMPLPIQPIIIENNKLKKFHAQHLVPNEEWLLRQVEPDCFIKQFKYDVVDELLKEIQIKVEETPDGIMYSADVLFKNM